ncbi:MAG: hypothetical protein WBW70_02795 [Candidatus Sulfotelmatobacter sp.]
MVEGEFVALELHHGFGSHLDAGPLRIDSRAVALLRLDEGVGENRGRLRRWISIEPSSSITVEQGTASALRDE